MGKIITVNQKGDLAKTSKALYRMKNFTFMSKLNKYGQMGVEALSAATPVDTGLTAHSWGYNIEDNRSKGLVTITWTNSNVNRGVNIALILQYGHATRGGGYVMGRDYINPAMQPIFDAMAEEAWKEVTEDA